MPPTKRADTEAKVPELPTLLRRWREAGVSFAEISFRLRTQHGVLVTAETCRKWHDDDNAPDGDAA